MVIVNTCSSNKSESKSVHISFNASEVKYSNNEAKDEEPSVADNSFINTPKYFKLFECVKKFLNKLDAHRAANHRAANHRAANHRV